MTRGFIFAAATSMLLACSPPAPPSAPSQDATATSTATTATAPTPTLQGAALGGQWSFDRSCGLYDLVFTETNVTYYDYSDQSHVVGYDGPWSITDNRVVMTLRRLNAQGDPSGDPMTYTLEVSAPVTTDLTGRFGPVGGATQEINAKQCAFEDRE